MLVNLFTSNMEKLYRNINYLFIAILLMAFAGFYNSYFGLFPSFSGITGLIHLHTFTVLLWFAILITQPILIRRKKLALHKLIGKISYGVVAAVAISMILLLRISLQKENAILIGIADLIFFLSFYILAMIYAKNMAYHIRFIVMTVLPFINPSLGRLALPGPILGLLIIIGLLIYEAFNKKIYRPYLIALPAYLIVYILFIFVIDIKMWHAFWAIF